MTQHPSTNPIHEVSAMSRICPIKNSPEFEPKKSQRSITDIVQHVNKKQAFVVIVTNDQLGGKLQHILAKACHATESAGTKISYNCRCGYCKSDQEDYNSHVWAMPNIPESLPFALIFFDLKTAATVVADMKAQCRMHGHNLKNEKDDRHMKVSFSIKKVLFQLDFDNAWDDMIRE